MLDFAKEGGNCRQVSHARKDEGWSAASTNATLPFHQAGLNRSHAASAVRRLQETAREGKKHALAAGLLRALDLQQGAGAAVRGSEDDVAASAHAHKAGVLVVEHLEAVILLRTWARGEIC